MSTERSYWLEGEGGRVLIGPASVLVGRGPDCDIVLTDTRVSRHHALFRVAEDGVEVIPLGRLPITVNGGTVGASAALRAGDHVACADRDFVVVETTVVERPPPAVAWGVERHPGALFRVAHSPFRVGGAADDDLIVAGWAPCVLALHRAGDALALEALREGVHCGEELVPGETMHLTSGARINFDGQRLTVRALPMDPTQITAVIADELPTFAELRFLPRGGRLTLRLGRREATVYLSDRRCDLVASLLSPPSPFAPGELVPDEVLTERIWPDRTHGRVELNTLVFRTRKELLKADIDGAALVVREGGGVGFRLARGAVVRVVVT